MLGVDVDVLLVLLFEGEWFLLLRVVVFISFFLCWFAWSLLQCGFASSFAGAFLLSLSVVCLCSLPAPLSLDAFALLSSPSLFRNVGRRLPSVLVLFGWLVRLARIFFSFVHFAIAP